MYLPASTSEDVLIPDITAPAGVDPTQWPVTVALIADNGSEPLPGDYKPAAWKDQRTVSVGMGAGKAIPLTTGLFFLWVNVNGVILPSGRVRVGDPRL